MSGKRAQGLRLKALEGTVLGPIAEAALRRAESLPAVTDETVAAAMAAPRGASGLREALSRPGRRFILEVKAASPSLGVIRSDIDLEACARAYARHADAVSVLTEPTAFGGSFGCLARMRALTTLPILAKDVTVDERQILAARAAGADAVLLMLSVLEPEACRRLAAFAKRLGLDVITEASGEAEVLEAAASGAEIIGINHRNLRDLTIDLDRSARLAHLVPGDRILVAESGIRTHADVECVARAARVFLVGSVLNQTDDVSLAVRRLVFGEMKVCGITRADDAARAALEGFSAAGVVLAKRSPKAVTPEALVVLSNEIKERTKALGLTMPVTAVVDAGETDVLRAIASPAAAGAFTTLQVHGDVTDADLEGLRVLFPGKALHLAAALPEDPVELAEAARRLEGLLERGLADRIVVDGTSGGLTGGSGRTVPQARLAAFGDLSRIRLAGGLTPENARAAAAAGAAGLDANSGVESAPGLKDPRLLALFAGAVRG